MTPDKMNTSIAIVGGAKSGKTELASGLMDALADNGPVAIIDDYVDDTMQRIDGVASFRGNYISNIAIALDRIGLEKHAAVDNETVITVGSPLESSVYSAMAFESNQQLINSPEEKSDLLRRVEATLKTMACFYMDSFYYDFVFYCGPTGLEQLSELEVQFEKNLQASFQAFALVPVIALPTEGKDIREVTDNRVKAALKAIEEAENESDAEGSRATPEKAV